MKTEILTYTQWWRLERSLNRRLPGDDDIPELEALHKDGVDNLKAALASKSSDDSDWQVPHHYARCPVLYCYIQNANLISPALLSQIDEAFPKQPLPWYAQLECDDTEHFVSGMIIVKSGVAYFCSEDSLFSHYAPLVGCSPKMVFIKRLYSKIVSRPSHIRTSVNVWGWKGIFKW